MATTQEAQAAVFDAVIELLEKAKGNSGTTRSSMVRDAGIAYRAAAGGPQPGSVVVEK